MRPRPKRAAVKHLTERYQVSERRACRVVGLSRSSHRYVHRLGEPRGLRRRLKHHAASRRRWGYKRLTVLLRRDGYPVNHKRVYRIYRAEGLQVRRRPRRRRCAARARVMLQPACRPNQHWAMDFMADQLASGRRFRAFTLMDHFTREGLALEVAFSLPSRKVIAVLDQLASERGLPELIVVDNGTEFTSRALDAWAYERGVQLHFIRPGKPVDNAYCESFNARVRDEFFNEHWFPDLRDAIDRAEEWRIDYNKVRPHTSLGYRTPREFAATFNHEGLSG